MPAPNPASNLPPEPAPAGGTAAVVRSLLAGVDEPTGLAPTLRCLTGLDEGRSFALNAGHTVIGRALDADVRVRDRSVSRRHASLVRSAHGFELRDLGGPNGVQLNGAPVTGKTALRHGDLVQLGRATLLFGAGEDAAPAAPAGLASPGSRERSLILLGGALACVGAALALAFVALTG